MGSLTNVLGSLGFVTLTAPDAPLPSELSDDDEPEPPELVAEDVEWWLLDTVTPTATPTAMSAASTSTEPTTCGRRKRECHARSKKNKGAGRRRVTHDPLGLSARRLLLLEPLAAAVRGGGVGLAGVHVVVSGGRHGCNVATAGL